MRYLYASLAAAMLAAAAVPAVAGTLLVPQQFPTIQAALNAAKPYDTVLVSAKPKGGVYSEAVTITTPHVVLQGYGNPIIDGTNFTPVSVPIPGSYYSNTVYPDAIDIRADYATISGLTVQNVPGQLYGASGGVGINAGYSSADGSTTYGLNGIRILGVTLSSDFSGVVISGFGAQLVNGKYAFTSAQGFSLIGCTLTGCTSTAANISSTNSLLISGNKFLSNAETGLSIGNGFSLPTANVLITGNLFKNNGYDGMDVYGTGLTVTANESALNGSYGILVDTVPISFSGTGSTPAGAAPTAVLLNSVHDNTSDGLYATGAQTISTNLFNRNTGHGIHLVRADKSTVTYNLVTGTQQDTSIYSAQVDDNGSGIVADGSTSLTDTTGNALTISGNQVSGNTGDGIYLGSITGSTISYNNVVSNSEIGIHLSDYSSGTTDAPDIVTQNQAVHNTLYDARDDSNAADNLTYANGDTFFGDNYYYGPSLNIWTKNLFGTTDPVGLSK